MSAATEMEPVLAALREHGRFTVTSHENPDGDALGSGHSDYVGHD